MQKQKTFERVRLLKSKLWLNLLWKKFILRTRGKTLD